MITAPDVNSNRTGLPATASGVLRDRIVIREAEPIDNEGLLALTRMTPMAGTISIRIDRDPDFFALLRLRGESKVFAASKGGQIVGCISVALRTAYLGGVPETVAYIGDMKVHPGFSGSRVAMRLIKELECEMRRRGVNVGFCVAADGNHRVMPLFEGRLGMPQWVSLGRFLVNGMVPTPFKGDSKGYAIETASGADVPAIAALLDDFHRSRQFAPQLRDDEIADGLSASFGKEFPKTYVARREGRVVATLTLFDAWGMKRDVLLDGPRSLRVALTMARFVAAPFPGFRVPRVGEALRLLSVRFAACEEEHLAALEALISFARAEAYRHRFSLLMFGLHERDPLRRIVRRIPRFTFTSLALGTSFSDLAAFKKRIEGIPFEDYALV